jgi:hypothetical protein
MTDKKLGDMNFFIFGSGDSRGSDVPQAPPERNSPPTWSSVMNKWSHPPGGRCTCGCEGAWSDSEYKVT